MTCQSKSCSCCYFNTLQGCRASGSSSVGRPAGSIIPKRRRISLAQDVTQVADAMPVGQFSLNDILKGLSDSRLGVSNCKISYILRLRDDMRCLKRQGGRQAGIWEKVEI